MSEMQNSIPPLIPGEAPVRRTLSVGWFGRLLSLIALATLVSLYVFKPG